MLLKQTDLMVESLSSQAHTFAFDILFSQLKLKLLSVPPLKVGKHGGEGEGNQWYTWHLINPLY